MLASQQKEQLVQIMRGFRDGAEERYKECADSDEHCADERVSREWFVENYGGAYRVEDEAGRLECGEDRERKGGDLDGAADDICHDEHEHAQLLQSVPMSYG